MTLRIRDVEVDNLNHYPETLVGSLRDALRNGAPVIPDPKRANFFEVRSNGQVFYIDVRPVDHRVILLAAWPNRN